MVINGQEDTISTLSGFVSPISAREFCVRSSERRGPFLCGLHYPAEEQESSRDAKPGGPHEQGKALARDHPVMATCSHSLSAAAFLRCSHMHLSLLLSATDGSQENQPARCAFHSSQTRHN